MIELIAPDGYMYVNRSHSLIGYYQFCPTQADADLWVLIPEAEALALEDQWKEANEQKRLEEELRHSELTYTTQYDSTRT